MSKTMQLHDYIFRVFALLWIALLSPNSMARETLPEVDKKYVDIEVIEPVRDAGYVIGDILHRKITLTIKKPYQLITESLPIKGYEHRYKGQKSGIELAIMNKTVERDADSETYILDLGYQVFKRDRVVKPAVLRAEILKLRHLENKSIVQYRIPDFTFRVSPLSPIGQIKLDDEMYPFIPPLTIESKQAVFNLKLLAGLLALSLLGLLYILGKHAWLPKMGAPFAKAYREVKKLSDSPEDMQQAVTRVHESLNQTAGSSLFINNLDAFIERRPTFQPVKQEIEQFFGLSHQVFFEDTSHPLTAEDPKAWLLQFCRRLRDCERGLRPDPLEGNA